MLRAYHQWMCVLFFYFLVCLSVYAYDSNFVERVPLLRDSTEHPITAHYLYVFLM